MGLLSVLVAVAFAVSFAATPQGAAKLAVYVRDNEPLNIVRMNTAGSYAAVLLHGGLMESEPVKSAILVEHFTFGWQALELLNFRCSLEAHDISQHDRSVLMRGMPNPQDDRPCRGLVKDAGPRPDVEAVRRNMRGRLIPSVVISGDFALGDWYGGGGGQALYRKSEGRWRLLSRGGGAIGVHEMRKYEVPKSAWCPFRIYDAKCSDAHRRLGFASGLPAKRR